MPAKIIVDVPLCPGSKCMGSILHWENGLKDIVKPMHKVY
jgi:hypothetical protein